MCTACPPHSDESTTATEGPYERAAQSGESPSASIYSLSSWMMSPADPRPDGPTGGRRWMEGGALITLGPDLWSGRAHISRLLMNPSSLFWKAGSRVFWRGGVFALHWTEPETGKKTKRQRRLVATFCTRGNIRGGRPRPGDVTPSRFARTSYRHRQLDRTGVSHTPPHTPHTLTQTATHKPSIMTDLSRQVFSPTTQV